MLFTCCPRKANVLPALFLFTCFCVQAQLPVPLSPREWAVQLKPGESIEVVSEQLHATVVGPIGALKDYYLLSFPPQQTNADQMMGQNSLIRWRQLQLPRQLTPKLPDDPRVPEQWHLNNTGQGGGIPGADANVFAAWDQGYSGRGIQICIVDDGLEKDHPELSPNFVLSDSWDFNSGNGNDPSPVTGLDSHGTPCAGVAGAKGDNGIGVAGVAYDVNLSGIRLIAGPVTPATEAMALTFHNDNNHIYSNSWGPSDNGTYQAAETLAREALREGATNGRNGLGNVYVWAAGNGRRKEDNTNYDGYVNSIYTIGVGAFADDGIYSYYSEPGASMLVSAPSSGGNSSITTTYILNGYTNGFGGTSAATPLVAGVVALMLEANPLLTWRDVQHILVESAVVIDSTDIDWATNGVGQEINHSYGFGAVDAAAAVSLAAAWENVVPASTDTLSGGNVNESIPDGAGTTEIAYGDSLSRIIHVDRDLTLEHVELKVNITHSAIAQVRVRLISPMGTESVLAEGRIVDSSGFTGWTFMTVRNWGENSAGDWTILIDDGLAGEQGTWEDVQLILHGTDNACAVSDLNIDEDPVMGGIYRTNAGITSSGTIPANSEVAFRAGTQIVLSPGFQAVAGSKFTAKIDACSPPISQSKEPREVLEVKSTDLMSSEIMKLQVYPNPAQNVATVAYDLEQDAEVTIELLDMQGRRMQLVQSLVLQPAGIHQLWLDTDGLPAGMYLIRMYDGKIMKMERLVVER
ncbi:MAG: S8 family serine peptidase [Saprospiraceae bacterium]|nr:S8 family serine peptidase [Lewinella sp.]